MHVYHYAPYEPTAIKRLMERHATREDEVDRLLRGGVFVDLYRVVKQGVRVSTESYSIKSVEKLYMPVREGPVTDAGFSVVAYERWMENREQAILDGIEAYNRDDCVSTWMLRDWLEQRRREAIDAYPDADWSRPPIVDGAPSEEIATTQAETEPEEAPEESVPADATERTEEQRARWLLAALLDWHRREAKPQWWAWHVQRASPRRPAIARRARRAHLRSPRSTDQASRHPLPIRPRPGDQDQGGRLSIDPATGERAGEVIAVNTLDGRST